MSIRDSDRFAWSFRRYGNSIFHSTLNQSPYWLHATFVLALGSLNYILYWLDSLLNVRDYFKTLKEFFIPRNWYSDAHTTSRLVHVKSLLSMATADVEVQDPRPFFVVPLCFPESYFSSHYWNCKTLAGEWKRQPVIGFWEVPWLVCFQKTSEDWWNKWSSSHVLPPLCLQMSNEWWRSFNEGNLRYQKRHDEKNETRYVYKSQFVKHARIEKRNTSS